MIATAMLLIPKRYSTWGILQFYLKICEISLKRISWCLGYVVAAPPTQTNKFTKFNLYSTYQSSNSNVAHTRDYKHHSAVKLAQMLRCYGSNTSYFTDWLKYVFPIFCNIRCFWNILNNYFTDLLYTRQAWLSRFTQCVWLCHRYSQHLSGVNLPH